MKLLITNLSFEANHKQLFKMFGGYGKVKKVDILKDPKTCKLLGRATVEMEDDAKAREAIRGLDGMEYLGRTIKVRQAEEGSPLQAKNAAKSTTAQQGAANGTVTPVSPYRFIERKTLHEHKPLKRPLDVYHDKLESKRMDVAFEIAWTTLTPTAPNPCTGVEDELKDRFQGDHLPAFMPDKEGEYAGYNRRWLMIGNRLAISPFTVKSAVAHGFANLLGGCYRVNSKKASHQNFEDGQYPYAGRYKRYRAAMDHSKPGLLITVEESADQEGRKGYEVEVQAVKEYYYENPSNSFAPGQSYDACWYYPKKPDRDSGKLVEDKNKKCLDFNAPSPSGDRAVKVIYYGPYEFGMNAELKGGNLGKTHHHRFYEKDAGIGILKGFIPEENFLPKDGMAKIVYMGNFKTMHGDDPRKYKSKKGEYWYDNLAGLRDRCEKGEKLWVYYEAFDVINPKTGYPVADPVTGKTELQIAHIGQNYQFKALFLHEDTVPEGYEACCRIDDRLCPRCRMFGMTEEGDLEKRGGGFQGRFRAAALVMKEEVRPDADEIRIRYLEKDGQSTMKPINTTQWKKVRDEQTIARQVLLPIQGPPKPNKRDIDGYFNPSTGQLKGAKDYEDGEGESLEDLIKETDGKQEIDPKTRRFKYAHHLRNYAVVCEEGCTFQGVVGAENCDSEEIAALFVLLESDIANHGFRLGQGKAFGLGSVESHIKRIWIRMGIDKESKDAGDSDAAYAWTPPVDLSACQTADAKITAVEKLVAGLKEVIKQLCTAQNIAERMNMLDRAKRFKLCYANPTGRPPGYYWDYFNAHRKKHET